MAKKRNASPWPDRIRALVARLGTQAELAARLRISESQVSSFINGTRTPTRPIAFLIELLEKNRI